MLPGLALSCLAIPTAPPIQACEVDLPSPTASVASFGATLAVTESRIVSSGSGGPEILVWDRTGPSAVFGSTLVSGSGMGVSSLDASGDRMAAVQFASGMTSLNVWERSGSGVWSESPPLQLGLPAGLTVTGPVAIEGDLLACRVAGGGSEIAIFDRSPFLGSWRFTEEVPIPAGVSIGFTLRLAGGRLFAVAGPFNQQEVLVFDRASGSFTLDATIQGNQYENFFDAAGDRLAIPGFDGVDVWRRDPSGWVLEQLVGGPSTRNAQSIAIDGGVLMVGTRTIAQGGPLAEPVRIFTRKAGTSTWIAKAPLLPPGGFDGTTEAWARSVDVADGFLAVAEPLAQIFGRIAAYDSGCLESPPVLHWVDASMTSSSSTGWPATGQSLDLVSPFSFDPGAAHGVRNGEISVQGDYLLDIEGRPCSQDYGTSICSYAAFNLKDLSTGLSTDPYPVDPLGGQPQLFASGPGPTVLASTVSTQIPWPFLFQDTETFRRDLARTNGPMDLVLEAQVYNCIDFGGAWVPDDPNVAVFSCGLLALPVSVTSIDFTASISAEVAFDLPELLPALQGLVCDGGVNGSGQRAELSAVGSSNIADNGLYFDVTGLIPGAAGLMFLSPQAAMAPFEPLGFGSLCLGAPFTRVPGSLGIADEYGHGTLRLELSTLPAFAQPQSGETWAVQWMYRDQGFVNTTSARTVRFQ